MKQNNYRINEHAKWLYLIGQLDIVDKYHIQVCAMTIATCTKNVNTRYQSSASYIVYKNDSKSRLYTLHNNKLTNYCQCDVFCVHITWFHIYLTTINTLIIFK